jgi:hypothetical protein
MSILNVNLVQTADVVTRSPWVDAKTFGIQTQSSIIAAITDIGTNNRTILLAPGTWNISANLTIPANITLRVETGALLYIQDGIILTISGHLDAGPYQIFSCAGTGKVVYAEVKYPEWWGAVGDDTIDCTIPLNAALANVGKVVLGNGTYKTTDYLWQKNDYAELTGGGNSSIIHMTGTAKRGLFVASYGHIHNFRITGTNIYDETREEYALMMGWKDADPVDPVYEGTHGTWATRDSSDLTQWYGHHAVIENMVIENSGFNAISGGLYCMIRNNIKDNCKNEGILICADNCSVINNIIKNTDSWGLDSNNSYTHFIGNTLTNCGDINGPHTTDGGGITIAGGTSAPSPLKGSRINGNTIIGNTGLCGISVSVVGATSLTDLEINNNQIFDVGQTAIAIAGWSNGFITDVRCQNNTIRNFAEQAILTVTVSRLSILGNQISLYTGSTENTPIVWLRGATNHFDVSNNVILGSPDYSIGLHFGSAANTASSFGLISNNYIHSCLLGSLFWSEYSTDLRFLGNHFVDCVNTLTYATAISFNVNIVTKDNTGYNPYGSINPVVPATTVAFQNIYGFDCMVNIIGGTVTAIEIAGSADGGAFYTTGLTTGTVMVPAGGWIKLTYDSVPTWYWFGN